MSRIILACALAGTLSVPAKALDGTPSPANVMPTFKAVPLDLPPDLLAQTNPGPTASLRDQLVGAWALVSCDGKPPFTAALCTNPNGIFILDASGHYAAINAARDRPKFTNPNQPRRAWPAEEYKAAMVDFRANFGTWSFNEADKKITYHLEGALVPNAEGTDFTDANAVSLAGDELKIGADVFRRIKK
jgi:Lipocalin-like domain